MSDTETVTPTKKEKKQKKNVIDNAIEILEEKPVKIKNFKMSAVIPVMQYGNIQPSIELDVETLEEGNDIAMGYINKIWAKYGETGGLKTKEISITAKLKSFNEENVEVDFDAVNHIYSYKGKILVSATNFIKKFYKGFDAKAIAKVCAKSWEVEQQAIEDMWSANGDLASTLGTLVDNALEHYDRYYLMGEQIKTKNGKDNPAMPKHPFLKSVIESFHALPHAEGNVVHQAFVSDVERDFCGQIDRLIITGEKKCIIQDFKVNIDSDKEDKNSKALAPFSELPATKITKYSLQVNFYRELLEKSGWTVEKMEAIVYEDAWKIYPLEVIKVIQ